MEKNWERTLPFLYVDRETINKLFKGIIKKDEIISVKPVDEGCRTSNYIIYSTDNKKYLLKIFFSDDQQYRKECEILSILKDKICVQEICKFDKSNLINDKYYVIYKYIEGVTLSKSLNNGDMTNEYIIRDAANILANIHKKRFSSVGFLNDELEVYHKLPPLNKWYEQFITDKVEKRLGKDIIQKIRKVINENIEDLLSLDNDPRLVHGDFQGTNILVDHNKITGIIDWEFAMAGHPLADIGQLFRYEEYFNKQLISIFEDEYRKKSDYILPDNWYKLSKIRDLANLIQLLDFEEDMPNKYMEIKTLIKKLLIYDKKISK